jgi:hypothetical protein
MRKVCFSGFLYGKYLVIAPSLNVTFVDGPAHNHSFIMATSAFV